ncbi:MAG: CBS domain-containing protein [Anaerolineae bacterium]|nr:CBS domain-containing protein [Anaerolineae bacterium]
MERAGHTQVFTVKCEETIGHVIEKMRAFGVSQLPVTNSKGALLGLVEEVNVLKMMLDANGTDITNIAIQDTKLISATPTVTPNTSLEALMALFNQHAVAVVQEGGQIVDIVTKIDLIDFLARR